MRVAPDGATFFVYNALDFEVVAYDVERLKRLETIRVCDNPLSEQVYRGKVLFHSIPRCSRWSVVAGYPVPVVTPMARRMGERGKSRKDSATRLPSRGWLGRTRFSGPPIETKFRTLSTRFVDR